MIYLSICIPTYNRVDLLRNTLRSITAQKEFSTGEVELVVSDNCSTDGTETMVRALCAQYPNIAYFRNEQNLGGNFNIHRSLALGQGLYRKLSNDTFEFLPGSIGELLRVIKASPDQGTHLMFSNGRVAPQQGDQPVFRGIDRFVELVSYEVTWDGVLGFWGQEYTDVVAHEDPEAFFWPLKAILKLLESGKPVRLCSTPLFTVQVPPKKDISYGLVKVFYTAYLDCYRPYLSRGMGASTFKAEERKLLYGFFLRWLTRKEVSKRFIFSEDDTVAALEKAAGRSLVLFRLALALNLAFARAKRLFGAMVTRFRR